ncbi:heparinase II/III-family protein [Pseudomonas sp. S 311-6]|uniref:heparinase II/III family protein n=1 Tax=Pseudomonas mosselii TaxID=78327 RepID=UPI002097DE3A|nr:heparinase II/III-family protein [Pseudomonas mosselii]MCO7565658.1 heparinase II/III-family protein [Pseudomonas mosselii]MCO7638979.1 heparinase II/III-family protein [Pseudomonas sp. S 311-6]
MSRLIVKVRTALALGPGNLYRALSYRLGVKTGLNPVRRLIAQSPSGPFFAQPSRHMQSLPDAGQWACEVRYFGLWPVAVGEAPPDWHLNPLTGVRVPDPEREWWRIADFDRAVGDIKCIWEASRFDWALAFAQRACNGDDTAIARLNHWLTHWCQQNAPYRGPNWKCGQEASIRLLHLAMSAVILDQHRQPLPGLMALVSLHLKRIEPTLSYAMAQDNNHGTSEAAALYIGGTWLMKNGHPEGERYYRAGRRWLENRACRLIERDGSFSQYSVNYHRVMLDTFSMVEVWRRKFDLPAFSQSFQAKVRAAASWLYAFVDESTGDAPNIGANDGARLLPLTDTDYRDFRPSVQLAMALFLCQRAYREIGAWDLPLQWLDLPAPVAVAERPGSQQFDQGGYVVLRQQGSKAVLRYPRFRFRPGQADALHLDLWHDGHNLLRDAGSFSYNVDAEWLNYFPGTASHNTVEFDERDQMPRLSRFLFGDWLRTRNLEPLARGDGVVTCAAGYRDGKGATHDRHVTLGANSLQVRDEIAGFTGKAILRWRLRPGEWVLDGNGVSNGTQRLSVAANVAIVRCELVEGWESRYYLEKTRLPVLEVEVAAAGVLITEYHW